MNLSHKLSRLTSVMVAPARAHVARQSSRGVEGSEDPYTLERYLFIQWFKVYLQIILKLQQFLHITFYTIVTSNLAHYILYYCYNILAPSISYDNLMLQIPTLLLLDSYYTLAGTLSLALIPLSRWR